MRDLTRILVVQSDPVGMKAVALLMELRGYQCEMAGSLQEAVELLRESSFDLVVMDCNLGGKGVAEIVRSLKGASPGTKLILFNEEMEAAVDADRVLPIPISFEELFECIETLSLQRRAESI